MGRALGEISIHEFEQLLDNYDLKIKIHNLIGRGGQKHVYSATLGSVQVAFKIMIPSIHTIERVKREIRATELINHPNVPKILHTNVDENIKTDELIWIIEEYIDGKSLRSILSEGKVFNINEIIGFFDVMLSVLEKSESLSIIHRDIKPENIILDSEGKIWLIDFGISRHLDLESITSSASPMGPHTLGYSASEQLRNRKRDIDIRADFFSLGVVAAEMIIGQNPYWEGTHDVLQLIKKIEHQPLPVLRIEGDSQYFLARFIKTLGDNRASRRPMNVETAKRIFSLVKDSLH